MHKNTKIQLGHLTLLVAALMQAGVVHAGFNFAPGLQLNTSAPITSLTGICSPSTNPSSTQTALCSVSAPTPTSVTISGPVQVPNTAPTRAGIAVNGDTSVINTVNLTAATIRGGSAAGGVVIANTASNVTLNIANDTSITVLSKSLGTGAAGLVGTNFTAVNNGQVTGGRVDGGFAYTQGAVGVNNDGVTPALGSGATGGAGTLGGSGGSGVSGTSTTGMGGAGIDGSGATLTNTGTITGGQAGAGGRAGRGGSAVGGDGGTGANAMPDVVNGMGGVGGQGGAGGVGGSGGTGGVGSTGGAGVTGNGFSLNNSGTITGAYSGYGGRSATGGDAESGQGGKGGNASVSTGTMNPASGAGGKGGDGGTGGIGGAGGSGGNDGIGGAGVSGTGFVVTNSGTITGGMGYKGNYGQTGGSASSRGGGFGGLGSNGPGTSGGAGGDGGAGGKGGTGGVGGNGGVGGTGGAGVTGTNFTLTNTGTITGGKGGYTRQGGNGGTANGGYGGNGGNGYFGADPTNPAVASGGRGGNGGIGGDGGTGGAGGIGGVGGTGGAGVSGSGFTLTNSGSIVGGAGNTGGIGRNGGSADGYRGGAGGATLNGSLAPFNMGGTAGNGGAGGNGGNGGIGGAGGAGGAGGSGGAGVSGASFTLANTGVIKGGNGAVGGTGGAGGTAAAGSGGLGSTTFAAGYASGNAGTSGTAGTAGAAGVAGAFGAGGVGVVSTGNSTVTNSGTISGGLAGDGTTLADAINFAGGGNKLVIEAGSILTDNVVSTSGTTNGGDTVALGGTINASGGNSFDLSSVGSNAKFRGFQQFAKEGTSTWTLTGTGAGNWNIAAGTLNFADAMALSGAVTVASGATLNSGTSLVTGSVSNGGMLSIAAGKTLSITGNFSNTGTFRPTLVDTAVGKVVATGAVAIGGNLFVDAAQLTAASTYNGRVNGVIVGSTRTGAFAQVADNSVLFDFTPVYSATGVDLTYATPGAPAPTPGPIPGPEPAPAPAPSGVADAVRAAGGTFGPAIGAAVALDTIINANPGGAIGSALLPLTTQRQVAIAASQTTPLLTGATTQATQTILDTINRLIQARNELNRGQSSGDEFLGNKAAWIKPFGSRARQGTRDNVEGYKANTAGLAAGIDGATSPTMRVGGAFVYAKSDVDSKSTVAPQSASINVYQLVGYGSLNLDPATNLDFQLDVGRNQNAGRRSIGFASTTANSSYDSQTAHAGVAVGRKLTIDSQTTLTPSLRADYTAIKDKAYSETGAGALGLNVDGRTARTFVIGADGKLAHQLNEQTLLLANLGLGYDTINDRNTITSTFAGGPGVAFTTYGIKPSPWMMRAGLGVVYLAKNGAEITGRYDAEHRSSFVNQTISVKARWPF